MQWLIDLIKEWIIAQGYLTTSYVDRGDPAADDFTAIDFTRDGTWYTLDLSGIIPANVKAVSLSFITLSGLAGKRARFRTLGNANEFNISLVGIQVANMLIGHDLIIAPDADGKIEYKLDAGGWAIVTLNVKGWWF